MTSQTIEHIDELDCYIKLIEESRRRLVAAEYEHDAASIIVRRTMESLAQKVAGIHNLPWDVSEEKPYYLLVTYSDGISEVIQVVGYGPERYYDGLRENYVQARTPLKSGAFSKQISSFGIWVLETGIQQKSAEPVKPARQRKVTR